MKNTNDDVSTVHKITISAQAHGIRIQQNEAITDLVSVIQVNKDIPLELYSATGQIITFLYQLDGKKTNG